MDGRRRCGLRGREHADSRRHRHPWRWRWRQGVLHLRREVLRADAAPRHRQARAGRRVRDEAGALPDAYEGFIRDNGFSSVANVFLVPTHEAEARLMGGVRFPGVFGKPEPPLSDGVEMWALPADYVFDCYLAGRLADEELIQRMCEGSLDGAH